MQILGLIQKLIRCKSITPKDDGAIDLLYKELSDMGFKCYIYEFEGDNSYKVKNLYARLGDVGPNFCFLGHTDVVSADDEGWVFKPFSSVIDDNKIYGRGIVDMKGAIACMIKAVNRFYKQKFTGSISFLITADEEGDAINGTKKLLEHLSTLGEKFDFCLVGEPTSVNQIGDTIKVGRRGSINFKLQVEGITGHVAYPELASNPITDLVNILYSIKRIKLDSGNDKFAPSNLEVTSIDAVNDTTNIIPSKATAKFNIRFNDIQSPQILHHLITTICTQHAQIFTLNYTCNAEAFCNLEDRLTQIVSQSIHNVIGTSPTLSTSGGTSDARFIKDYCPTIECGLLNNTAHKVDEHCSIEDIFKLTDIYYEVIKQYFNRYT